jgi:hypothetical protein
MDKAGKYGLFLKAYVVPIPQFHIFFNCCKRLVGPATLKSFEAFTTNADHILDPLIVFKLPVSTQLLHRSKEVYILEAMRGLPGFVETLLRQLPQQLNHYRTQVSTQHLLVTALGRARVMVSSTTDLNISQNSTNRLYALE